MQSNFRVQVSKDYLVFASAHFITFRGHQCETLHGHNYRVGVAVEGAAMGGGFGIVCCADHVLAHTSAQFATPEVTLGIVPAQIAPFVVRRLGPSAARRCLLTGERWDAVAAQRLGLVDDVVEGDMDAAVWAAIARHAAAAPQAVAATKRLLLAQAETPLPALLDEAAIAFSQALRGPEAPQGLAAFAARKAPPWSANS